MVVFDAFGGMANATGQTLAQMFRSLLKIAYMTYVLVRSVQHAKHNDISGSASRMQSESIAFKREALGGSKRSKDNLDPWSGC